MRKPLYLLLLLFASLPAWSQSSLVTATVTDSDGTNWANGTWEVNFRANPDYPNPNIYNINGVPLNKTVIHQQGSMDNSGFLSMSIYDSTQISPAGSGWTLQICPQASAPCGTYIFSTTSSVMNISAGVNSVIPVVRFKPVAGSYGYNDVEAVIQLQPGSTYYNVTLQAQRYYFAGAWSNGGLPPGITCTGTGTAQICTFSGTISAGIADWVDPLHQCKPNRGVLNIKDCGVVSSTSIDQTVAVKIAMQAARTYNVPLLLPGGMTVDICNLSLDSTTNSITLNGPATSGGGGGATPFTFQATSTCTTGPTVSGTPLVGGVLFDAYTGGGFQRAMVWKGITFDLRNIAIHAFLNSFAITWTYQFNTFTNMKADVGQGNTNQNRSIYIYDDLAEYADYNYNYFQSAKGYSFYATNCNRCTMEHNLMYTTGGVGFFGGYAMTSISDDWEGALSNPWDSTNSIWQMGTGTFVNEISNMYIEITSTATCGTISSSVTSNVATVVSNCVNGNFLVGNYVGVAGSHVMDSNNGILTSVTTNTPVSGQTTLVYNLTHADVTTPSNSITGFPSCTSYPNVGAVCFATFTTVPTGLRVHDWLTISGTGTCADGSHQTQVINGLNVGFSVTACTPAIGATGSAIFGAVRGGQSVTNPTVFYARQNYGTLKLHGNYANFGTQSANFGAAFANSINVSEVSNNTILRADAVFQIPGTVIFPAGSRIGANYINDVDTNPSYGIGVVTISNATDTQGAAWLGDSGASYSTSGHRHTFYGGPLTQCAAQQAITTITSIDLGLCNIQLITSTNPSAITAVYNAKVTQVDNTVRAMPGYYTFQSASNNLTLPTSLFNNSSGADFKLPSNRPVTYQVDYNGTLREVGAWSTLMSQAIGSIWYSDGNLPKAAIVNGIIKGNNTGVPTVAVAGTDYLVPSNHPAAILTTTAAASDVVTVTGMTSSGHCQLTATNASAATNIATTYISAKASNQITVTHAVTAGMTYDVNCYSY